MKKLYVPRKQLKVYIPEPLYDALMAELSKGEIRNKPGYGEMSKLVTLLLKKHLAKIAGRKLLAQEVTEELSEFL